MSSPLSFCVLGSGSAGNCTVLLASPHSTTLAPSPASARTCLLIDAGLSPRRTAAALAAHHLSLDDVSSIIVTHFDTDHFHSGWIKVIARRALTDTPLRIHAHRRHRRAAWRAGLTARETSLFDDAVDLDNGVAAEALLLAHDDLGSVGFVIEHHGHRLGYATDLGRVPRTLIKRFVNLHALCIESNYDPPMQHASARPAFLKSRIMNGSGHLSNEQAIEATRQIERHSRLSHIALLHLSRECNCPKHVRSLWQREMPHALANLTITHQTDPTPLLHIAKPADSPTARVEMKQALLFPHAVQNAR